jgi:hypothetical protein
MALTGLAQTLQSFIWGVCVDWLGSHFCRLSGGYVLTGLAQSLQSFIGGYVLTGLAQSLQSYKLGGGKGYGVDWLGTVSSVFHMGGR